MRKQKLFNRGNSVLFKGLTTKLHLCCTAACPVVFRLLPGNSHDASEERKLIESIYPKNTYEYDKTIALIKAHGFHVVILPKKNRKHP